MVVEAQGADGVDKAHVDAALGHRLAFGVETGGFVNGDVAHRAGWKDALGAGDVEGAGVIEAVEGIDAGDPGEDAAFFFRGEEGDFGGDNLASGRFRWWVVLFSADGLDHINKIRGCLKAGNFGEGFLSGS